MIERTSRPSGYDVLATEAALYRDASRRVLRLTGERAADMLQGLITADIRDPGDGAAWPTLILTPKGRVLADAVVVRVAGTLLLDVPDAAWPDLEPHFARYLPPRFAKLEPSGLDVVRIRGPRALPRAADLDSALAALPAPIRTEKDGFRWSATRPVNGAESGETYVRRHDRSGEGLDLYLPAGEPVSSDALNSAGRRRVRRAPDTGSPSSKDRDSPTSEDPGSLLAEASAEAWEIWRIERGIPLYGRDITQENLPQETGLVSDVTSFSKGCYTGQEVLARIHYRGKVNRHLRGLRVRAGGTEGTGDGGRDTEKSVLARGDELHDAERSVGSITSAVRSPRFGWIGLGYVRHEVEPGDVIAGADGISVSVEHLPFPE